VTHDEVAAVPEHYWNRSIVVTDLRTQRGDVIGQMTIIAQYAEDDTNR
jgi:hypothetical protein